MDQALRRVTIGLLAALLALPCGAQILAPILYGHGGGASAPSFSQIRCETAVQTFVGVSTVNVTLPSCATAGDLVVLTIGTQNHVTYGAEPAGWSYLTGHVANTLAYWGSGAYSKILVAGDIGSTVNYPLAASGNAVAVAVEFEGTTGGAALGDAGENFSSTNPATATATTPISLVGDDTILFFGSYRGTAAPTISAGTVLQSGAVSSGTGAAVLSTLHETGTASAVTATVSYPSWSGDQGWSNLAIVVHGVQWTPRSIPGLNAWFSAGCITMSGVTCATPSDGTAVTAWYNQASYGSSTMSGTCTYHTGVVNSQPAVTFDGSTCYGTMNMPTYSAQSPNKNISFGAVWKNAGTASKGTLMGSTHGGYAYWTCSSSVQQGMDEQAVANIGYGTAACDTSFHQTNAAYTNGTGPAFRIGEAADATQGASGSGTSTYPTALGANVNSTPAEFLNGKLAEIMLYGHALQASEITALESYFHAKYGL